MAEKSVLEKTVVNAIIKKAKENGIFIIKTHGGAYQTSGLPDLIAIAPNTGVFVGIECKRPGGREPTDLQKAMIKRINESGGVAGVAHSIEEAFAIIDRASGEVIDR